MISIARVTLMGLSLAIVACGRGADSAKNDPNKPAVVVGPPPPVPVDTSKPDTIPVHFEKMVQVGRKLAPLYSLLGATVVLGDRRTAATLFAPDAELRVGDVPVEGVPRIVSTLTEMARRNSAKDFTRMSKVLRSTGSVTVIDSGSYAISAQRDGGLAQVERGTYVTEWRNIGGPDVWVIVRDHLKPAKR